MTPQSVCRTRGFGCRTVVVAMAAAWIAGCASGPQATGKPEQVVAQRASDRWKALIAGDVGKAYAFLSPATRGTYKLEEYRAGIRTGLWRKADVKEVRCQQDVCDVVVEVTYQLKGTTVTRPLEENWVFGDGNWWFVFKTS